jgi:outer membrane murein-binding lipoprotein Lpp
MSTRVLIAAVLAVVLVGGCDEGSKKQEEASVCRGLNKADCSAKTECSWNADKGKCKKEAERMAPEQSAPPAASEQAPPEQGLPSEQPEQSAPEKSTPPAQSEPAPSEESEPPSDSPEDTPQ